MGIVPEVVMWRDIGARIQRGTYTALNLKCVIVEILWALYLKLLCGEILAHVYSVEPEILM
ncbi:hypothetical protein HBR89_01780 [Staphylococcus aureus]|nr:hypothetical protein [Staphylococcus aureus]